MSAAATAWAWRQISAGRVENIAARLVLLKLADRADERGICWPGHERTAADCALSTRGERKAQAELERAGLVQVERRKDGSGRDLANRYWLPLGKKEPSTSQEEQQDRAEEQSSAESKNSSFLLEKKKKQPSAFSASASSCFKSDAIRYGVRVWRIGNLHGQDDQRVEGLVSEYGELAVESAAAALAVSDTEGRAPLPRAVEAELRRRVASAQRHAREAEIAARPELPSATPDVVQAQLARAKRIIRGQAA